MQDETGRKLCMEVESFVFVGVSSLVTRACVQFCLSLSSLVLFRYHGDSFAFVRALCVLSRCYGISNDSP